MLSVMAIEYAANSSQNTGVITKLSRPKYTGYPCVDTIAPSANPVLKSKKSPSIDPIIGTNIRRQMEKLFMKMYPVRVLLARFSFKVWLRLLLKVYASWELRGTKLPITVNMSAIMKIATIE